MYFITYTLGAEAPSTTPNAILKKQQLFLYFAVTIFGNVIDT